MNDPIPDPVKQWFAEAIDIPAEDLSSFLEARCGRDSAGRAQVEILVRAHHRAGRFLDPEDTPVPSRPEPMPDRIRWLVLGQEPGGVVDRYRLIDVLGEGGFGVVFRAEQLHPVQRLVALKVVKAGMESASVLRRFEAERQTLASMDHPGIARLLDAGTTDTGRPYFVMELIDGVPITQFVRDGKLSLPQSADLFVAVCSAVHHAHRKGILHRDLKPSNILVGSDGVPKVIDFGIAKAIAGPAAPAGDLTEFRQFVGTPRYMSPEQSALDFGRIDTRSDVYSLGAVLTVVATGTASAAPVPPEFNWITRKATDADPRRRYDSAAALGDDLRRLLDGLPVEAGPPGVAYQLRKFAARHKTVVSLTTALLVGLVVGLIGLSVALARVRASRDQVVAAESVRRAAELDAISKLRDSYLMQARARRRSGLTGQRFASLTALAQAAGIGPGPDLRDEVIACLSLPDFEFVRSWNFRPGAKIYVVSPRRDCYVERFDRNRFRLVRVADGQTILSMPPAVHGFFPDVEFSPDGRFLAAEYPDADAGLVVWELSGGKEALRIGGPVGCKCISPDGRSIVVATAAGTIDRYDLPTCVRSASIPAGDDIGVIACRPGSDAIAVFGPSHRLRLARFSGGEPQSLPTSVSSVAAMAWSPDGRQLVVGGEGSSAIQLIDCPTATVQATLLGRGGAVFSLCFADHGRLVLSGAWDGTVRVWDVPTGKQVLQCYGAGYTLAPGDDQSIFLHSSPVALEQWRLVPSPICAASGNLVQNNTLVAVAFSPNGRLLTATTPGGLLSWSIPSFEPTGRRNLPAARSVAFVDGGRRILVSTDTGVRTLDGADLSSYDGPVIGTAPVGRTAALAVSHDGSAVFFGDAAGNLFVAPPSDPARAAPVGNVKIPPRYVAVGPDGRWGITAVRFARAADVWDLRDHRLHTQLPIDPDATETGGVAFAPDGRTAVTSDATAYYWWSVPEWVQVRKTARQPSVDHGLVAFSHDGTLVALAGPEESTVLLVDPRSGNTVARLENPAAQSVDDLTFNPDDTRLALAGFAGVVVWDLREIRAHLAALNLQWPSPP